ncbi:transcription elongation factor Spt5 [archaeon]|jgi:transcription termination/antitermination protein NusG|nr:transcription elongation factor Spt5 [archaeon]MBT6823867.1 transcription elongation factor Spt5 [archaeon]MBT7107398.1 transcription elongation factor Spt5 [archaeon]MBT7297208.1 transcription elongation factor Spt5 [archaeon]
MEEKNLIFALKVTANREDQVLDFISENVMKKGLNVYSIIRPHGLRGYIFIEADSYESAETSYQGVPYAKGLLRKSVSYSEIEHMLEHVKAQINVKVGDVVEIISGPFKGEQAKINRIDKTKEEVIVELLEAAVPIPITVNLDSVKTIRREGDEE